MLLQNKLSLHSPVNTHSLATEGCHLDEQSPSPLSMPVALPIDSLQAPACSLAASQCRKKSADPEYKDDIACRSYICPLSSGCSERAGYKAMRYMGLLCFSG